MNASIVSIIHRFHCTAVSKRWIFNQTYEIAFSNGNTQQHNFKCSSQQDMIQIASYIASIPYSSNIGMEINLMFRKINFVLPNFIPSILILILALTTLNAYTLVSKHTF